MQPTKGDDPSPVGKYQMVQHSESEDEDQQEEDEEDEEEEEEEEDDDEMSGTTSSQQGPPAPVAPAKVVPASSGKAPEAITTATTYQPQPPKVSSFSFSSLPS
jgi:hypothetical protein